uniref:Uncharacterized protein n=1 Tax=Acrobeloides nanus TaxID=290746 RepID=A0A914DZ26_9BILA
MVRRSNDFDKIKREIDDLLQQENKTPSLEIKSAILNLKDKPKFEDLNNAYKKLVNLDKIDSSYLPEQNYYLGFIELARYSNMDPEKKDKIHKLLGVARFLFNRKAASKTVLISLIKFYHFQTPDQFINLNSFEEQQIQQSDVYKLFRLSVENVLGRQIKPGQLVKVGIDETQAYDAIGAFKSAGIITEPKVLPINETDMLNIYKLAKKHKLMPIKLLAFLKEAKVDQITPEYISTNLKLPKVASFQIFEEWVSDILERSIDEAFEKQMKKFKAEIVRYLRDVIDKECSIPLMDQKIYDDSQLAKEQEKIIQTRTKRYTEVDPLKSEYCAILWDFYVKTNEKRWLSAIFQENVPLPLARYAVDACCQTLCKTLKSLLNSFGGLKLVIYGEEVVLESKSGDDMLTELHVLSLNGYFYLAPIENMDCFRKNDNHYLSVLEALIAEFDECEIFEGNYLGFSKQMSIHALTELNYL